VPQNYHQMSVGNWYQCFSFHLA